MYYLKLEKIEKMGNGMVLVTTAGRVQLDFVVPEDAVTTQAEAPNVDLLEQMRRLTSHIEGLSQPPNLSPQRVPEPSPTTVEAPDREAREVTYTEEHITPDFESLGLQSGVTDAPFKVNEEVERVDIVEVGRKLNKVYEDYPDKRRQVVQRVAGMVRLDMLRIKGVLCPELRRGVLGSILGRDSLKTSVVPPDLAAFVDDRPLSETLGSRQWDPGSEQAKDNVSSNWMESEAAMNKIAKEVDDSEFDHLYPSTSDVAVQVNRKFSSADKPKR